MSTKDIVDDIALLSHSYQPSKKVSDELASKYVVGIIGPFGVGKSTLMKLMEQIDPDYGYVLGITTRPRRPTEEDVFYRYLPHTQKQLAQLKQQLVEGELVQLAVHPSTGYIYGSDLESYAKPYNVLDILTSAIPEFETLPFKSFQKVYITLPVQEWRNRLQRRATIQSENDIQKRWLEAKLSLEWALANQDRLAWVNNTDGDQEQVAKRITELGKGRGTSDHDGPTLAQQMLDETNRILSID